MAAVAGLVIAADGFTVGVEASEPAARAALDALCLGCHRDAGRDGPPTDPSLDLDRLVRERVLVQPGNPEGSPLLTRLLRHEVPHASMGNALPRAPTAGELLAIRAWIAQLPTTMEACKPNKLPALDGLDHSLRDTARRLRTPVRLLRVLTLAHVDTTCRSPDELAAWRKSLALLIGALAGKGRAVELVRLDDRGAVLALDLKALDWDDAHWRVLVDDAESVVRADWLVSYVVRGELGDALVAGKDASGGEVARIVAMLRLVAAGPAAERAARVLAGLMRSYEAGVDLNRAAAELDETPQRVLERVRATGGDVHQLVVRLAQGGVSRRELEPLMPGLATAFGADRTLGATPRQPLQTPERSERTISLHTDKISYSVGDPVEMTARSSVDCHLTVISIDTRGRATVIFPNDLAPRNFLRRGEKLKLPGDGAGYRLRFATPGREALVAVCSASDVPPDSIVHDFERQRFQELGDYATFLERAWTRGDLQTGDAAGGPRRNRGRGERSPPSPPTHETWRTGVVVEIK